MTVWLSLVSLNNEVVKNTIQISGPSFTIGRATDTDLSFPDQKRISGIHCKIWKEEGKLWVEDLSSNGTFVNGQKIGKNEKVVISDGNELSLVVPSADLAKEKGGDLGKNFISFLVVIPQTDHIYNDIKDDYVINKTIGEGNFAEVKLGVSKETSEKVALKIIDKKKFAESAQALRPEQLDDEIKIMKKVKHPHLLEVINVYDSDSELILVLEFAEKGDLFDAIVEKKHYSEEEGKEIFAQLASAVHYLHLHEIVHRDLKPENILISKNGIKVSDFGLSKMIGEDQMAKTLCGTPQYLAPEVIFLSEKKGNGGYGKEVDIWSMGVILFVLLAGYPPFEENKFGDIKKANFNFNQPVWKKISENAKVVDTKKRFTIPEIFEHPWMKGMEKYLELAKKESFNNNHEKSNSSENFKKLEKKKKRDDNPNQIKKLKKED